MKEAKGNPSRRPLPKSLDVDPAQGAVAPAWLKGEGRKIWDQLAPRVTAMKLLTSVDAGAFARYCRNFADWLDMQRTLDREGKTYESESAHGRLKRIHPAFAIAERLDRQLQATEDRFGLNPAERQRIFAARAAGVPVTPEQQSLFGDPSRPAAASAQAQPALARPIGMLN